MARPVAGSGNEPVFASAKDDEHAADDTGCEEGAEELSHLHRHRPFLVFARYTQPMRNAWAVRSTDITKSVKRIAPASANSSVWFAQEAQAIEAFASEIEHTQRDQQDQRQAEQVGPRGHAALACRIDDEDDVIYPGRPQPRIERQHPGKHRGDRQMRQHQPVQAQKHGKRITAVNHVVGPSEHVFSRRWASMVKRWLRNAATTYR